MVTNGCHKSMEARRATSTGFGEMRELPHESMGFETQSTYGGNAATPPDLQDNQT